MHFSRELYLLLLVGIPTGRCVRTSSGDAAVRRRRWLQQCIVVGAILPDKSPAQASNPWSFALPERKGLTARWLEEARVLLQDQADAVQYGGELAPGGPPPQVPALSLVPILQIQVELQRCRAFLRDESMWPKVLSMISTGPFEPIEFKRIFNQYSDNIYYSSGSTEANLYLLGGATPSSRQTTQYLLRNEILRLIVELVDEIKFQQGQPPNSRESSVMEEYLLGALSNLDEYLRLAPPEELKIARIAVPAPSAAPAYAVGE